MRKNLYLIVACLSLAMLSSCATLFTGTKDTIYFNTQPEGATVYIDGVEVCKSTPCSVRVSRSLGDKNVQFKLDGYKARVITLDKEFNAVSILNFFGLIGWGVDAATGSIMKYGQKGYDIELDKKLASVKTQTIEIDTEKKEVAIYVQE